MTAEVEQPNQTVETAATVEEVNMKEDPSAVTATSDTDSDSDDNVPELEDADDVPANKADTFAAAGIQEEPVSKSKQSRRSEEHTV